MLTGSVVALHDSLDSGLEWCTDKSDHVDHIAETCLKQDGTLYEHLSEV